MGLCRRGMVASFESETRGDNTASLHVPLNFCLRRVPAVSEFMSPTHCELFASDNKIIPSSDSILK